MVRVRVREKKREDKVLEAKMIKVGKQGKAGKAG